MSLAAQGRASVMLMKPAELTLGPLGSHGDRVQKVKGLCGFFAPSILRRKSVTALSKCKLESGLLCAALTEHWHSSVRLSGWVGTVESAGSE